MGFYDEMAAWRIRERHANQICKAYDVSIKIVHILRTIDEGFDYNNAIAEAIGLQNPKNRSIFGSLKRGQMCWRNARTCWLSKAYPEGGMIYDKISELRALERKANDALRSHNIAVGVVQTLHALSQGVDRQTSLAEATLIQQANIAAVLGRACDEGWVKASPALRQNGTPSKRDKVYTLTKSGRALLRKCEARLEKAGLL